MISNNKELTPQFFRQKTCVIAKSGYGKSYATRVIIEEGLEQENSFLIVDPQGAYENFEGFEYIDIKDIKDFKKLVLLIAKTHINTVIITKGSTI